jgi:hypothetical protein
MEMAETLGSVEVPLLRAPVSSRTKSEAAMSLAVTGSDGAASLDRGSAQALMG